MLKKYTNIQRKIALILFISIIFISYITGPIIKGVQAAQTTAGYSSRINSYPGYTELLESLKSKYPNWNFKILYTGLDWNQVIKNETIAEHGRNLVSSSKTGSWVCSTCGSKTYDSGAWKCASETAVSYYMDPRNWLNENYIFQFENLAFDSSTQTQEGVQKIIESAPWMSGSTIRYRKTDGSTGTIYKSFAQIIYEAGREANISPYHLASRIVLEQGKKSTASSTGSGTYSGYEGCYNYYNISAYGSGASQIIARALTYARNKGWTDPESGIKGGAKWIASQYVAKGQSTLYLEKFDVDSSDGDLYSHQYMGNVAAAVSESTSVKKSYNNLGMMSSGFTFIIPVFENMPSSPCPSPNGGDSSIGGSTVVTQNVSVTGTNVNIRNSASQLGTIITKVNTGDVLLRIECGATQVNGYYWDKIVLPSGTKGYIARNYISQIADITSETTYAVTNTSVNLRNGPGTSGTTVVTTLISGQSVTIIERGKYDGLDGYNWARVKLQNGTQGYIAIQYLTETGVATVDGNKSATVKCDQNSSVTLRQNPTTSSNVITRMSYGTIVTVMEENVAEANGYNWDKVVTSSGLEGYVANKYLEKSSSSGVKGDVNGNSQLDAGDYVLVKNHIMGKTSLNSTQLSVGDFNSNGQIDAGDYVLIKNELMK